MWVGTAAGCALFILLGLWQLRRGLEKAHTEAAQVAQASQLAIALDRRAPPADDLVGVHARAAGHYRTGRQMLLDNQSQGDQAGYDVLTPLEQDDGSVVIVNRGWIPHAAPGARALAPPAEESRRVVLGAWRRLPEPAVRLAGADNCSGPWPRVVEYPTPADLVCLQGPAVLAGELLLDPSQPDGFVRDWRLQPEFPPARHYAYAAQWFGFAAALMAIFLRHLARRR